MNPIVDDKYQIISELGRGGMGVVYEAVHLGLGHRVAIKFLSQSMRGGEPTLARFVREARAGANISSDHVAKVFDIGITRESVPFIVMELLEGDDLANVLVEKKRLRISDAARFVIQASTAMAAAHSIGVIHRDLKPENLFLLARRGAAPIIKILDFGLAKITSHVDAANTEAELVFGTPRYMAPEQLRSSAASGPEADVWALGVILYQMLAGRRPFDGPILSVIVAEIMTKDPLQLRALREEVPESLEAIVHRCLSREPAARPTAIELAELLLPFSIQSEELVVRTRAFVSDAGAMRRSHEVDAVRRGRPHRVLRRRDKKALLALTLALFSMGLGVSFWLAQRPAPTSVSRAAPSPLTLSR